MLPCMVKYQCSSKMAVMTRTVVRRFASFDPLEAKMAQKRAEVQQQQQIQHNGEVANTAKYATKNDFKDSVQGNRFQGAAGSEDGQVPTSWQKRFLVLTKLYPSVDSIPPYVHHGTMNRMHDRMRVVFIVTASVLFFTIFYIAESTMARVIDRDRQAGVVVTKM